MLASKWSNRLNDLSILTSPNLISELNLNCGISMVVSSLWSHNANLIQLKSSSP